MAQQTVMNELLVWVRKTLPMDLDYPRMIEDKIESLILKEKEQIISAHKEGNKYNGWALRHEHEKYYNETYGENKQE